MELCDKWLCDTWWWRLSKELEIEVKLLLILFQKESSSRIIRIILEIILIEIDVVCIEF